MNELIAKKYAKALMQSGDEAAVARRVDALRGVAAALSDAEAMRAVTSPLIDRETKASWLIDALGDAADEVTTNLIRLMAQKGRLDLIPQMVELIDFEQKKASNRFEGVVHTDEPLSDATVAKLEKALEAYSGAEIRLEQNTDAGHGLKVEVNELGIELSYSREKVKHALIEHIQKAL
jgi:F-type H+-transporting ATPase subunit delta